VAALARAWQQQGEVGPWRKWLLGGGIAGLMWPLFGTVAGQPSATATVLFGSVYFWSVLAAWLGLFVDGIERRREGLAAE